MHLPREWLLAPPCLQATPRRFRRAGRQLDLNLCLCHQRPAEAAEEAAEEAEEEEAVERTIV